MIFSSIPFICAFLPITILLSLLIRNPKKQTLLLLTASILFYAYGEPVFVLLLIVEAAVNYFIAPNTRRHKSLLTLAVVFNLGVLIIFKYLGFLTELCRNLTGLSIPVPQIALPVGISFFTFQGMSYVIDVYRRKCVPQKSFIKMLLYLAFFPQLIAGPIVRYEDIAAELENRTVSIDGVYNGLLRFMKGLAKKVLIANMTAQATDLVFQASAHSIDSVGAWIGALMYTIQIYYDFSGYSDMAIGLGEVFGFHFLENFNNPYRALGIRDFWRKWHISLSTWFKEYLYIPLGGNRHGKLRTCINKMIVFLCTGIWHGANLTFLFWGLYHGILSVGEEIVLSRRKVKTGKTSNHFVLGIKKFFIHLYSITAVTVGFVLFRADSLTAGLSVIKRMFLWCSPQTNTLVITKALFAPAYIYALIAGFILCLPIFEKIKTCPGSQFAASIMSIIGLTVCIFLLSGSTYNPFIYFRF